MATQNHIASATPTTGVLLDRMLAALSTFELVIQKYKEVTELDEDTARIGAALDTVHQVFDQLHSELGTRWEKARS
jgi:hypothetical protein